MSTNEKTDVIKEQKAADTKKELQAENKKEATKKVQAAAEDIDDDDEEEEDTDNLFAHRESINLTPDNAWFSSSTGGLISLKVINAEGKEEFFERVVIRRSFPITAPDEFLSVREPDTRKTGRGAEIGMIRNINVFDKKTMDLLNSELDRRYFTPEITHILSAQEKFGYCYWDIETTAGPMSIIMTNPFSAIRSLEDKRIIISDIDGNRFVIPDPQKLDRQSFRFIEIYI